MNIPDPVTSRSTRRVTAFVQPRSPPAITIQRVRPAHLASFRLRTQEPLKNFPRLFTNSTSNTRPAPASINTMEVYANRLTSFKPRRLKPPHAKRFTTLKFPHPHKIESLAEAGFYWNPTPEDKDQVECFLCGKTLAGWEEDDDPLELHWLKCREACGWASSRCGLVADLDGKGK